MKRITKLCRAFLVLAVSWLIALQLPLAQPLHTLVLLVRDRRPAAVCARVAVSGPPPTPGNHHHLCASSPTITTTTGPSSVPHRIWLLSPGAAGVWGAELPHLSRGRQGAARGQRAAHATVCNGAQLISAWTACWLLTTALCGHCVLCRTSAGRGRS